MTLVTPESPEYKKWREENGPKIWKALNAVLTFDGKVIGVFDKVSYGPLPEIVVGVSRDESEKRQEWYDREEENNDFTTENQVDSRDPVA